MAEELLDGAHRLSGGGEARADYDCLGGSGDGPLYTGRVVVAGYDRYRLDADGDGIGCES